MVRHSTGISNSIYCHVYIWCNLIVVKIKLCKHCFLFQSACPFCAVPLTGNPGFVKLIFQDKCDWWEFGLSSIGRMGRRARFYTSYFLYDCILPLFIVYLPQSCCNKIGEDAKWLSVLRTNFHSHNFWSNSFSLGLARHFNFKLQILN